MTVTDPGLRQLAAYLRGPLLRLNRMMRLERPEGPLTLSQLSALGTVDRSGPLSAGQLAAAERVAPSSLSKVIASLEQMNLIVRQAHPDDKRQAIINITGGGAKLMSSVRESGDAWLAEQLSTLTPAELALIREVAPVLDKLTGYWGTETGEIWR